MKYMYLILYVTQKRQNIDKLLRPKRTKILI